MTDIKIPKSKAKSLLKTSKSFYKSRLKRSDENQEEIIYPPNLFRECIDETCNQQEAKEALLKNPNKPRSKSYFYRFWETYKKCNEQAKKIGDTSSRRKNRINVSNRKNRTRRERRVLKECLLQNGFQVQKNRFQAVSNQNRNNNNPSFDYNSNNKMNNAYIHKYRDDNQLSNNPCDPSYDNCHRKGTIKCIPIEWNKFKCQCKKGYSGDDCSLLTPFKKKEKVTTSSRNGNVDDLPNLESYKIQKFANAINPANEQRSKTDLARISNINSKNCYDNTDCQNFGICRNGICDCTNTGYSGKNCENDVNECLDQNLHTCQSNIHCKNLIGGFKCICAEGYRMNINTNQCEDINECNNPHLGQQVCDPTQARCVNTIGSYTCQCMKEGYAAVYNESSKKYNCENINECENDNGGCDHTCVDTVGSYACNCENGYSLDSDDHSCTNVNECLVNNAGCKNKCIDTPGSFKCSCDSGFILSADGVSCVDDNECTNPNISITCDLKVSKCVNTIGSYSCECNQNFLRDPITGKCHATDQCRHDLHRCKEPAYCQTTTPGNYRCVCPDGYNLSGKYRCNDINECLEDLDLDFLGQSLKFTSPTKSPYNTISSTTKKPPICGKGFCKNTSPGYICNCFPLYTGKNCNQCKCVNGSCPLDEMSDKCKCDKGWTSDYCDQDINECLENNGGCSHNCSNQPGSYSCSCPMGYDLARDNKTCKDINECKRFKDICQNGKCINNEGSYTCECNQGFITDKNNQTCIDVDECKDPKINNCQHECQNTSGSYNCVCKSGFSLNKDQTTCSDIDECSKMKILSRPELNSLDQYSKLQTSTCNPENTQQCVNSVGSFSCICKKGYSGQFCQYGNCPKGFKGDKCDIDVNECKEVEGICAKAHQCRNTKGSYRCICKPGYYLRNDECRDINECEKSSRNRKLTDENICGRTGVCLNKEGSFTCDCFPGFESGGIGSHPSYLYGNSCKDINECLDDESDTLCQRDEMCVNTFGSYKCRKCLPGEDIILDPTNNRRICQKKSCSTENSGNQTPICQNGGTCINTQHGLTGYTCKCTQFFTGTHCEIDLDECMDGSATCVHDEVCVNTFGGYECKKSIMDYDLDLNEEYYDVHPTLPESDSRPTVPAYVPGISDSDDPYKPDSTGLNYFSWLLLGEHNGRNSSRYCEKLGFWRFEILYG